jgi:Mg2+/Co2+ transporter CorB
MEVAKMYEPVVVKSFWRKYNEEQIQAMSDEEVMQIVDAHLEQYILGWQKRNKNKDLPDLAKGTIADVRNKRTNISKAPKIVRS